MTKVYVDYGQYIIKYEYYDLNQISHAYCVTAHKMQGSESRVVIGIISKDFAKSLLNRNMLYTIVTRAREKCILLVDSSTIVNEMIDNRFGAKRESILAKILADEMEKQSQDKDSKTG